MKEDLRMFGTEFNVRDSVNPSLRILLILQLHLENKYHLHLWLYCWHDPKYASLSMCFRLGIPFNLLSGPI